MNALKNLATDDSIANERDSVGGSVLESGLYPLTVSLAYVTTSSGGATGIVTHFKTETGRELRQTHWVTSGKAKGGKNYYEKDGVKHYLPGFLAAQALALLTVGKELADLEPEQKVANIYSKEAKAEVPTKVDMLVELLGKPILAGVVKQIVDKTQKNDADEYVPTGETRTENEIDKFFRASDRKTTAEIRGGVETGVFADTWLTANAGKVRDRSSAAKGGKPGTGVAGLPKAGAAAAATGTKKPVASLFG